MGVEVKTKLTLDDSASAAVNNIKQGFQDLHEQSQKTTEGLTAMQLVLTELAAHAFEVGLEKAKEFGESLVEAAEGGEQMTQRIAGMTAAVQGVNWNSAKDSAVGFFEKVQDVAINTKQPMADVQAGFARLVEIQGATPAGLQKSLEQTEQMANVARTLGTSVETIGGQFAFMEEGAIKVKSQMYQLLQPTGIFEHKTGTVVEWWSKLTNASRAELLSQGLEKMSSRMAHAAPTFKDTVTQLDNVWDTMKERLGGPFLEAMQPQIQKLTDKLLGSSKAFDHYAEELGVHVGEWVNEAADTVKEGFQFIEEHEAEIGQDIKEAWRFAKEVVEFIIAHKEVLALAAGARMVGGGELAKGAAGAASGVFGVLSKAGAGMAAGIGFEADALGASFVGATLALGVMAAAVGSVVVALDQWDDLMKVTGGGKSSDQMDFTAIQKQFQEMIKAPDMSQWGGAELEHFDHMRANLVALADKVGESGAAAGELADAAYAAHNAAEQIIRPLENIGATFDALVVSSGQLDSGGAVEAITTAFQQASAAHNEAAMSYIGNLLSSDAALQQAFLNSSDLSAEGFKGLAAHISDSAKGFADALLNLAGTSGKGAKEVKPTVNFSGGQTFKINQDFRDQDPDRIAVVFRSDVLNAATNRIQAATSTPFGA